GEVLADVQSCRCRKPPRATCRQGNHDKTQSNRHHLRPGPPLAISVALPAVEVLKNRVKPPLVPLAAPPLLINVPLPAVEASLSNSVKPAPKAKPPVPPPLLVKVPLPAVEVSENRVKPPSELADVSLLLVKVPVPAVEVLKNSVCPPVPLMTVPPLLVNIVRLPAVALLKKDIRP